MAAPEPQSRESPVEHRRADSMVYQPSHQVTEGEKKFRSTTMPEQFKYAVPGTTYRRVLISVATLALLLFTFWAQVLVPISVSWYHKYHNPVPLNGVIIHVGDGRGPGTQQDRTEGDLSTWTQAPLGDKAPLPLFYSVSDLEADQYHRHVMAQLPGVRKVMALVFYNGRDTTAILDCYLKRNLVKNGGIIDGVMFVVATDSHKELDFLDQILASEASYSRWDTGAYCHQGHSCVRDTVEDDIMYINIDDGIVFIEDTAIPSVVNTKAAHPELFSVSANIINLPEMSTTHQNLGAAKPNRPKTDIWYRGRRPHRSAEQDRHLAGEITQHYRFFENLENGQLEKYRFSDWQFWSESPGAQLAAIMGRDIRAAMASGGSLEHDLFMAMLQDFGRNVAVDGNGLASYYSPTIEGAEPGMTDVLDRYRYFTEKNICRDAMLRAASPEQSSKGEAAEEVHAEEAVREQLKPRSFEKRNLKDKAWRFLRLELDTV